MLLLSTSIGVDGFATTAISALTTGNSSQILGYPSGVGTKRVSIGNDGKQGKYGSYAPSLTPDGRFLAFESESANMVSGDSIAYKSVFVRDMQTGQNSLISIASDGTQANGISRNPTISSDGRYVAFESEANNLVEGDTNNFPDIFVNDRQSGTTKLISIGFDGAPANERNTSPSISSDGRYVVFYSNASNLVNDDNNGYTDVFVYDRQTDQTELVSVSSDGTQGNTNTFSRSISGNGRFVAYASHASNLVADDLNGKEDIFIHDLETGITELISVASDGTQGNDNSGSPSISFDGRYVAFNSYSGNLVDNDTNDYCNYGVTCKDVFVRDRQSGTTERISISSNGAEGNDYSSDPRISIDGRYIAFGSKASNLVPWDNNGFHDVYVHDRNTGITELISTHTSGMLGNNLSYNGSVSANGQLVAFTSQATNLVNDDTNGYPDIYLRDRDREEILSYMPVIGTCTPLYFDGFDDPDSGWPITDHEYYLLEYLHGEYRVYLKELGYSLRVQPNIRAENYAVSADIRIDAGPDSVLGLTFGGSDNGSEYYSFEIDPRYKLFGIYRYDEGIRTELVHGQSDYINYGNSTNHLEIIRNGGQIIAMINGVQVASITDSSYVGSRYVGIIASKSDKNHKDLRFDNFRVNHLNCVGLVEHTSSDERLTTLEDVDPIMKVKIEMLGKRNNRVR